MRKNWEAPVCNFCHKNDTKTVLENVTSWEHPGTFTLVQCKKCGLVFVSPRPGRKSIGRYYPKSSYWGVDVERDQSYGFLYKLIERYKKSGSIFDIGAGTGMFLSYFKDHGWKTGGVELSTSAVRFAQKNFHIALQTGDFLDFNHPKESYDVVTLNNSLEHLFLPQETLQGVAKILKKKGVVVITLPNIKSLGFHIFGRNWYALQPPRHLYHFSEKTLSQMLVKAGFRILAVDPGYQEHNYATLFESFRLSMSPRFEKKPEGGLAQANYHRTFSLKKEVGKRFIQLLSYSMMLVGPVVGRSEVITVVAQKR